MNLHLPTLTCESLYEPNTQSSMKNLLFTLTLLAALLIGRTELRAADAPKAPEPTLEQRVAGLEAYLGNTDPTAPLKDKDGKIPKRWPSTLEHGWTYKTPCKTVFPGSTIKNDDGSYPSLFQVMSPKDKSGDFSNTDEFHWVCAWLNAITNSFNFPYSGDQVIGFWNAGKSSDTYKDALTFFKTYMEQHTS